jgi:hypothetical protein
MDRKDAIDRVLLLAGELPLKLTEDDDAYQMAKNVVDSVTYEVLAMGWRFNTTYLEDGTESIDTVLLTEEEIQQLQESNDADEIQNEIFNRIPAHIRPVIVSRAAYEFVVGYTGENQFSQELYQVYLTSLAQAKETEVMLSAELIDFERIYKNVASQLLNEEGWWWNTIEQGDTIKTNIPRTLPPIADAYARIKAQRIFQAHATMKPELLLQPTPEEQEIYQQLLIINRRKFLQTFSLDKLKDTVIAELKSEALTKAPDYNTANNSESELHDGLAAMYADIKAKRIYMLATERENPGQYIQPSQDEINLYQRLVQRKLRENLQADTYEEVLENIRTELKNEVGWWYNTVENEDGTLSPSIPATLPQIVDLYAEIKARRIYQAYTTGQAELLFNPTPEEQQAFSKMLEEHYRQVRGSKGYNRVRKEVLYEVLAEGWAFNTIEITYKEYKDGEYKAIKVYPITTSQPINLDYSTGVITYVDTNEELEDDVKLMVIYEVDYTDLPQLVQSYIDIKAARLYNFYNSSNPMVFSSPTNDELVYHGKIKTLFKGNAKRRNLLPKNVYSQRRG